VTKRRLLGGVVGSSFAVSCSPAPWCATSSVGLLTGHRFTWRLSSSRTGLSELHKPLNPERHSRHRACADTEGRDQERRRRCEY
jgi:hypothetical protein